MIPKLILKLMMMRDDDAAWPWTLIIFVHSKGEAAKMEQTCEETMGQRVWTPSGNDLPRRWVEGDSSSILWEFLRIFRAILDFSGWYTLPPITMVQWNMAPKRRLVGHLPGHHFSLNHDYGRKGNFSDLQGLNFDPEMVENYGSMDGS